MRATICFAVVNISLCLVGCGQKPATRADLSSDFREIASSAAESDLFIERLQKAKVTKAFAKTHTAYLADQAREARRKLDKIQPAPGLEQPLSECRRQQALLLDQLNRLPSNLANAQNLEEIRQKIGAIRKDSEHMRAHL